MLNQLKVKCENLMTFIPSNLYIHSNADHETLQFSRLTIPDFLTSYIESSIEKLIQEKEDLTVTSATDNQVYLYVDPFQMSYLTWPIFADEKLYTITLGPLISNHLTSEEIRYIGFKMKLSSDNCFILESFYGLVPHYDAIQIARISSLFLDYLYTDPHLPKILREDHTIALPEEAKSIESKFQDFDYVANNYAAEAAYMKAIETGNVAFIKKLTEHTISNINIPSRFPTDPLREYKNLTITMNSISLRAAVKGGLNPSIAHSLSHNWAIQIEQQTTVEALRSLTNKIMLGYTESVQKYGLKGHSRTIVDAITYIRNHLTDKVTLGDIADYLHLSNAHLSRRFSEEMAMTLTDYIHKTKAEESASLLISGRYTISQVAYIFGYSSPAHYSKMFTKAMGMAPKEWRKQDSRTT